MNGTVHRWALRGILQLSLLPLLSCASSSSLPGGGATAEADLQTRLRDGRLRLVNRTAEAIGGPGAAIRLGPAEGDGLAWIEGVDFSTGIIQLRVRGRNLPGQSSAGDFTDLRLTSR